MPEKRKIISEIEELLQLKEEIRITMEQIVEQCVSSDDQKVRVLNSRADPQDFDCYTKAVRTFSKNCYDLGQVNLSSFCSKMMRDDDDDDDYFGLSTMYLECCYTRHYLCNLRALKFY